MRILVFDGAGVREAPDWPAAVPETGWVWVALERAVLQTSLAQVQAALVRLTGTPLLELHVSDLLNPQLPSRHDATAAYDLLVFRRLAAEGESAPVDPGRRRGPPVLRRIQTVPVGCALFERLLLTVHPPGCGLIRTAGDRLLSLGGEAAFEPGRSAPVRGLPTGPADLMLRLLGEMVDGFLALRHDLSAQLEHWQTELLDPRSRFRNWSSLLEARLALQQLERLSEDQRLAVLDWIATLGAWPAPASDAEARQRELLRVRSRDVLEHIERVGHHVRRLEQSAETAVQIHFSAQSHRTNDIMRTLTVLTAIFLPLNLIAGIFGMNFEFVPLLHTRLGFWLALGGMALVGLAFSVYFWRKRYLRPEP